MRDDDLEHFDRWALHYDRSWTRPIFFRPVYRKTVRLVTSLALKPRRVLDVGCGTGALCGYLASNSLRPNWSGWYVSTEMIRMAEGSDPHGAQLRFLHGKAEELPFHDGSFDLVLSTVSFHHWRDRDRGLREIERGWSPVATSSSPTTSSPEASDRSLLAEGGTNASTLRRRSTSCWRVPGFRVPSGTISTGRPGAHRDRRAHPGARRRLLTSPCSVESQDYSLTSPRFLWCEPARAR